MSIIKQPFVNYRIGEPDPLKEGRVFTVRLSADEYKELLYAMKYLNISSDSTALKTLAFMGKNVVFTLFQADTMKWLTDGERRINQSKLAKINMDSGENVTQKNDSL